MGDILGNWEGCFKAFWVLEEMRKFLLDKGIILLGKGIDKGKIGRNYEDLRGSYTKKGAGNNQLQTMFSTTIPISIIRSFLPLLTLFLVLQGLDILPLLQSALLPNTQEDFQW